MNFFFTTCVECLHSYNATKHFEGDGETSSLMLAFTRLRLSRWGESVGIYEDPNLGKPDATPEERSLALQTVQQMKQLIDGSAQTFERVRPPSPSSDAWPALAKAEPKWSRTSCET